MSPPTSPGQKLISVRKQLHLSREAVITALLHRFDLSFTTRSLRRYEQTTDFSQWSVKVIQALCQIYRNVNNEPLSLNWLIWGQGPKWGHTQSLQMHGGISYIQQELQQPLAEISQLAHFLQTTSLTETQQKSVDFIHGCSEHLKLISDNLLDGFMLSNFPLALEEGPFKPQLLLNELNLLCHYYGLCLNTSCTFAHQSSDSKWLVGDKQRIKRVFMSLLLHFKFIHATHQLDFNCHLLAPKKEQIQINCTLSGVDLLNYENESNSQQHLAATKFNLQFIEYLVAQLKGTFSIQRQQNKWLAQLGLKLSLQQSQNLKSSLHQLTVVEKNLIHSFSILVAEDHTLHRKSLLNMLAKLGYHADCAETGQEAIMLAYHKTYQLILMSIHLPQVDGIEASVALKNLLKQDCPTLVGMTESKLHGDNQPIIAMDDLITKPILLRELTSVLERWHQE